MKQRDWLKPLGAKEEKVRAVNGLIAKVDGWYKTFDGKTRYICKPCPVKEAAAILPNRIVAIRKKLNGDPAPVVRITAGTISLSALADSYQAWLYQRLTTGMPKKLARRTYDDAVNEVLLFVECVGLSKPADAVGPADFSAYARKHLAGIASSSVRRKMIYIEAFANWAAPGSRKAGLLLRPWQYGADFQKPSADDIAMNIADSDKAYTPAQLRKAFLRVKRHQLMRAVGWLALCGAFGPKDIGLLPESLIDLKEGIIRFPRGKTGVGRLCWLPKAARLAIESYLEVRPAAAESGAIPMLFRTARGRIAYRDATGKEVGSRTDNLGWTWHEMTGLPLSGLRSTFATHADDFHDQRAVDIVLGHKSGQRVRSVRNKHYAKKFSPERVQQLVSVVVPRSFGRNTPSPGQSPSPALVAPRQPAAPPAVKGKLQPQPDQSSTGETQRRGTSRRSPSTPES